LFPGNVIGYQRFDQNGIYAFGLEIPNPFNLLANSVSTNSLVTPLVKAGQVSTSILRVNNQWSYYSDGYINSLATSTIQVARALPGGGEAYQYFNDRGLYVFGVEIPGGNLKANSVSTVNLEADFIKAKGDLIGSNNNTFSWGIGNARSYIVTSTIGVTPSGVAGFPNVNVGDRLTVGNSALFTGGAQFTNAITGTTANFSGNVTTSNTLTGNIVEATQNFQAQKLGFVSSLTADIASISTNSVQNLFVSFVNGQAYPPQSGITGATPSTMLASTVFVNGGLTNTGLAPIISPIGNFSTLSSVRVQGLLTASNVVFNAGMTNTGALPIITSNLSAVNINNVSFINGAIYPPPTGSTSIPSTLYASTLLVNGGQTITGQPLTFFDTALGRTNGNIIANSGTLQIAIPEVGSPGGSAFTITAGSTLASTLVFIFPTGRSRFTSSMTVRDPVPTGTPSQAYITTYSIGSESPAGSVITSNVSTNNIQVSDTISTFNISSISYVSLVGGNISTNAISTNAISTNTLSSRYITASTMSVSTITDVSTINNIVYPPPGLTPVGAITIWAGGTETTTSQNFNPPAGWLICDGTIIYQSIYPTLYSVIGTKYGGSTGIPNTAFLPDLTFAVPMGTPKKPFGATPGITDRKITFDAISWSSSYAAANISTIQTWRINAVQGGTLNYGTLLNDVGVTGGGVVFPKMYVSSILQFDGNPASVGYIIVRSVDNTTPIPIVSATSTIQVNYGYGVLDTPASGTDAPYQLGTYNVEGHPLTIHNQAAWEVYPHTHQVSQVTTSANVQNFTGTNIYSVNAATNVQTGFNTSNTISTFGAANIGTYTAPNFLNMLYIIKY
jgi:hypothetical protein